MIRVEHEPYQRSFISNQTVTRDALGRVITLDEARVRHDTEPHTYGNQTEQTGPLAEENPIRFSSEYHDKELGLIYYNYRHYNPKDGRWINRDTIAESGGNNLYGFVGNNPYEEYDFWGMSYFGCIKDCYKDNDPTGTIIDNIVSYLTGASIP